MDMIPAFHRMRAAILAVKERPGDLAGGPLSQADRQALRQAPHLAGLLAEIREEAERAKTEPIPALPFARFGKFHAEGTRKEFETPYFERRGRLLALTLKLLLDEDSACVEPLEELIWEICGEYSWAVPAHLAYERDETGGCPLPSPFMVDLFAAETAHALAETLYLIGDRLHPWIRERIRQETEKRIFRPVFESESYFFWFSMTNNWSAVCGGAVGMAALLLIDDKERLAAMQDRVATAMESFLTGYGEDGCCPEGLGYWNYGFGYFVYWAEMLYAYTGGAVDVLNGEKIRRIAEFPGAVVLTAPTCVNYSDCSPVYVSHTGLASRLSARLGIAAPEMKDVPSFHSDHCYRLPHQVRNLLWTRPGCMGREGGVGTFYFPSTEWLVDKRRTSRGLFAFSAKGGHNGEPHNHNDLGHFLVHAAGETLLVDLGPGVYTRDYFGPGRYRYLHNASSGHSVPVIGGFEQEAGEAFRAVVVRRETEGEPGEEEEKTIFELDLTQAYGAEAKLEAFRRTFVWECREAERTASLTLTDSFLFANGAEEADRRVTEHFISYAEPAVSDGTIVWKGERGIVAMQFEPALLRPEIEVLETRRHDASPVRVYRTALRGERLPLSFACRFTMVCGALT